MDNIDVSVIIPIHNGSSWIKPCFESILGQSALNVIKVEICVCNDSSNDDTETLVDKWKEAFDGKGVPLKVFNNTSGSPKGVGYAKNRAIGISTGTYLCFQDVDDIMMPDRILEQYNESIKIGDNYILGSQFKRCPDDSTGRYTKWANSLTQEQLHLQVYTSHGPTVIMPTWFCHKNVYEKVGTFSEEGKGTPEDLIFFYKHLDFGGKVKRIDKCLLVYYFHKEATTFSIHKDTIWNIRLKRLEDVVLAKWDKFTIWNAGKQGKRFYNSLQFVNRSKVIAMCDVDVRKIRRGYTPYDPVNRTSGKSIDIVHFKQAIPPFVICVKLDLTVGSFERNLESLKLTEGVDYVFFS